MPPSSSLRSVVAVAIISAVITGLPIRTAAQGTPAGKKLRLADVNALLQAGDYERAATTADEVVASVKPTTRDKDYLPRMIECIQVLERRGHAQLRLGRLDDAAATLQEAQRAARDPDLKRLLEAAARGGHAEAVNGIVHLDLIFLEILDLRMAVILERLRFAALGRAPAGPLSAEQDAELGSQVAGWLDDLETLEKVATPARRALARDLEGSAQAVLDSPYNRSVAGRFRPSLAAGLRALELSRLPDGIAKAGVDAQAAAPAPAPRRALLDEALRKFDEAAAALDEAIATAAPKGVENLKPEARIEADLLQAELLTCQGAALLERGDAAAGRARAAEAIELLRSVATRRRLPQPDTHGDLLLPMLVQAEALRIEARTALDAGDAARALDLAAAASALLVRVDALSVPSGHPLRSKSATLRKMLDEELAAADAALAGFDAAAAAARRLRRAVDGTDVTDADFVP